MPGVVRIGDAHIGHASPTPSPFHQTTYVTGSGNVLVNGRGAVRIGDITSCTDPAVGSSPDVFVNGILVHRLGDATGGHGSWVPNASASSSSNVFANGGSGGGTPADPSKAIAQNGSCVQYDWNNGVCLD